MSDFDDEARKRAAAIALLDHDMGPLHEHRHIGEVNVFAPDDLDMADAVPTGPGEGHGLARAVSIRDQKWDALNQVAKFARINPPTALQGVIGGQQQVGFGGPALQVANWGGEDAETLPVTVTLAPVQQIAGASADARPYGIVQFGTRGFLVKAYVDLASGVQFTVGASQVTVQVGLDDDGLGAGFDAGGGGNHTEVQMKLAGMLSFYPVTHAPKVTRTAYLDGLDGTTVLVPVPPFARDVVLWRRSVNGYLLTFLSAAGVDQYEFALAAGVQTMEPIPLSGDIRFISVVKTAGVAALNARLIFGLGF